MHMPAASGDPEPVARSAATWLPPRPGASRGSLKAAAGVFIAAAAATAACGIPAGFIWAAVAPRVLVQVLSPGAAGIVNAETSAFIVADVWFCLIGVAGGLLTGAFGYWLAIRRRTPAAHGPAVGADPVPQGPAVGTGPAAAAGLILGALAAAAIMLWIGDLDGHAAFRHQLAVSAPGTYLHASLALGAKSGLAFWPMATALTIAVIEIIVRWRTPRP